LLPYHRTKIKIMAMCNECFTRVFNPEQYSVCSECQILSCDECRRVCHDCYDVLCGCCYEAHPCFNEMEEEEEEEEQEEEKGEEEEKEKEEEEEGVKAPLNWE